MPRPSKESQTAHESASTANRADKTVAYTVVKVAGDAIGGIMNIPPEASGAPRHWGAYTTVGNVDQTASSGESLDGKIMMAPRDIPGVGRFTVIQDPLGAVVSLITYSME